MTAVISCSLSAAECCWTITSVHWREIRMGLLQWTWLNIMAIMIVPTSSVMQMLM